MQFEIKNLKNKVEGISEYISSPTTLSEAERRFKLRAYRSANKLCDNVLSRLDLLEKRLHEFNAKVTRTPHRGPQLENITKTELYAKAQDLDIAGRSLMSKSELIDAIRETW